MGSSGKIPFFVFVRAVPIDERTSSPVSPGLGYFLVFSWYS